MHHAHNIALSTKTVCIVRAMLRMRLSPSASAPDVLAGIAARESSRPLHEMRWIVPAETLPSETRRRVGGQSAALAGAMITMAEALGAVLPDNPRWPEVVALGWWWSPHVLGHCTRHAWATIPACGKAGVRLDFGRDDADFRLVGFEPFAAASLGVHEVAHALLFGRVGPVAAESMLAEAKGMDADMPAWVDFCSEVSIRVFGSGLPAGYDFARWPVSAPGSLAFVDALAERLAQHALPPVEEAEAQANVARVNAMMERSEAHDQLCRAVERLEARLGTDRAA